MFCANENSAEFQVMSKSGEFEMIENPHDESVTNSPKPDLAPTGTSKDAGRRRAAVGSKARSKSKTKNS